MGLITDILAVTDSILSVRDTIGAVIHTVYFVTRTWSGSSAGDGTPTDVATAMSPSPAIIDLSHELPILKGGVYQQGDLILKHISKQSYPSEDVVACKSSSATVEKFYKINNKLYQVVNVKESYVTWEVHIRKLSHA